MFRWGLVLAVGGCAQLAGIDNTSKGVDAAVGPVMSSLQLERVAIGKTVVKSPQDLTPLNASFLVTDEAAPGGVRKVTTTRTGMDTWVADTGGVAVPVMFETPDSPNVNLRIADFPSTTLKWPVVTFEHPNAEAAPNGTTSVAVNLTLPTPQAGQGYQLFTIGAWSVVGIAGPADTATQLASGPITITAANSPIRRLDKITAADDLVTVLRYAGNQLVGHYITMFDQMATNTVSGAMLGTPLDKTLDIRVNQTATTQRLSTLRPAYGLPSFVWRVHASPGADYSAITGPQLNAAGIPAPVVPDPQTITAAYGNPFPFKPLMQWDVRVARTYTGPTGSTVTLSAGMTDRAEPSPALVVTSPAGLPDRITANATLLTIDNAMVMAPANQPVEVSFITDATNATNTVYVHQLFELVPTVGAPTYTQTVVVTVHAAKSSTKIPRELFKPGSLYVLRAFSFQGCYPAAASGDIAQPGLPCGFAFADSGVFQVVTP